MDEMATNNMDIRCTTAFLGSQTCKGGAKLSMGIDLATHSDICNGVFGEPSHYVITYVVNREQFLKLKNNENGAK